MFSYSDGINCNIKKLKCRCSAIDLTKKKKKVLGSEVHTLSSLLWLLEIPISTTMFNTQRLSGFELRNQYLTYTRLQQIIMLLISQHRITACEEKELGIKVPNTNRIPDRYMTSSTQLNSKYPAFRGRIGVKAIGSWGDGWCASDSDANPYIQVYFGKATKFASCATFLE